MSQQMYNGNPREEIPWFPRVDGDRCTGCGVCTSFCPGKVYEEREGKASVVNPYGCVVGCSGCVPQCPPGAISFPSLIELRDALKSLRTKYRQEAR
ncbi:MAG: 4Fe-4S dicluster domain-containing protein [Thermoplasmata archaeon]